MHTPSPANSTGTPGNRDATEARSGKSCHDGTLIGETVPAAVFTGPAEAMPTPATAESSTTVEITDTTASQVSVAGVGTREDRTTAPEGSTRAAAILVPPKSSASTRSVTVQELNQGVPELTLQHPGEAGCHGGGEDPARHDQPRCEPLRRARRLPAVLVAEVDDRHHQVDRVDPRVPRQVDVCVDLHQRSLELEPHAAHEPRRDQPPQRPRRPVAVADHRAL